jgi:Fe-S-cluster containining protein
VRATPFSLAERDRCFIDALDRRLEAAALPVLQHLECRLGCTECCIGPFDITPLDAWRLRRGLDELRGERPEVARALLERAQSQWVCLREGFPGEAGGGRLTGDEARRRRFFAAFGDLPCPLLDPASGACVLYEARPVSCRTFGLPIRCGGEILPPCRLNFRAATPEDTESAVVDPDPEDDEGRLLRRLARENGGRGDTIVAWVLASA